MNQVEDDFERKVRESIELEHVGKFVDPFREDLCLMLDTSCSMDSLFDSIKAGAIGVLKYANEIDKVRECSIVNFSCRTFFSGWIPKTNCGELESLLTYQGGGSSLDLDVFKRLNNKTNRFFTLVVTDGDIYNRKEISQLFGEMNRNGNSVHVLYVGDLRSAYEMEREMEKFLVKQSFVSGGSIREAMLWRTVQALEGQADPAKVFDYTVQDYRKKLLGYRPLDVSLGLLVLKKV